MEKTNYKQDINFTPELMARINELISHYPEGKQKSALLPVLHEVQDAHDNWLSLELQTKVAEILKIKPISVKYLFLLSQEIRNINTLILAFFHCPVYGINAK